MNVFYFEFGYDHNILQYRQTALVIPAPKVKSLLNADVDYETNVEMDQNMVTLQIETASMLRPPAGILIKSPPGFGFSRLCRPMPAPPPALPVYFPYSKFNWLPWDVKCSSKQDADGSNWIRIA